MQTDFLASTNGAFEHQHPWQHYVVDNFFPKARFKQIQSELCTVKEGYLKREADPFDLRYMFVPNVSLAKFFIGEEFHLFLEQLTGHRLEIYEKGLVQLRLMTEESPAMVPHVDDQEQRSLVVIWYLSDWAPGCGGELNLLSDEKDDPRSSRCKVVEPLANRLVLFFSDDKNWHSVNKVKNWNRYSIISEWVVKG